MISYLEYITNDDLQLYDKLSGNKILFTKEPIKHNTSVNLIQTSEHVTGICNSAVKSAICGMDNEQFAYWIDFKLVKDYNGEIYLPNDNRITVLQLFPLENPKSISKNFYGGSVKVWRKIFKEGSGTLYDYVQLCPELFNLVRPKTYHRHGYPCSPRDYLANNPETSGLDLSDYIIISDKRRLDYPLVSVIIPTYNRYILLQQAIASVKTQTYTGYEIIIVDDGSSDQEYQNLKDLAVDLVVRIPNSRNTLGRVIPGGRARNYGMLMARGKYLAFLDDDDIWVRDKLEVQLKYMGENNLRISGTNAYLFGDNIDTRLYFPEEYSKLQRDRNSQYGKMLENIYGHSKLASRVTYRHMVCMNHVITSSVIMEKSLVNEIGYFRYITDSDDYDYWLAISRWNDIGYISQPMLMYRVNRIDYTKCPWTKQYIKVNLGFCIQTGDHSYLFPDDLNIFECLVK